MSDAVRTLFELPLIQVDTDQKSGVARWAFQGEHFWFYDGVLWWAATDRGVPLARIAVRDQALQFSLGWVLGGCGVRFYPVGQNPWTLQIDEGPIAK